VFSSCTINARKHFWRIWIMP